MSATILEFPSDKCKFAELQEARGRLLNFPGHKWFKCDRECEGCMFCEGGLALCVRCGGGEASLPSDCPGIRMPDGVQYAISHSRLDYRYDTGWIRLPSCEPVHIQIWQEKSR